MNCTRCEQPIAKGQPYSKTKRGPHHFKAEQCARAEPAPSPTREETPTKLIDKMVRDFTKIGPLPKSEVRRRLLELFDAGAKSVVAAPQNELLEELATVIDGYVGTHGCPEDAPCKQCVWANEVTDRWALYAEKNESRLAGAAALPSAQNEWISVEERLPEREGHYLVHIRKRVDLVWHNPTSPSDIWFWKSEITYWRELPSPPVPSKEPK